MMSAQGWTPGSRLGARDAAHADMLTAASHSHIKVTIKDDTLGLGARAGREGEPTGLDAFKGLLGRLNGKSDGELLQEQRKRDDVKLARYAAMKFPEVRFVRGGLLAQEKLEALPVSTPLNDGKKVDESPDDSDGNGKADPLDPACKVSKSKSKTKTKTKSKSKSKSKSSKDSRPQTDETESSSSAPEAKKDKKSKKRKAESATDEPETRTERRPVGRQVLRGRHIAQKKKALMDEKSLNEVSLLRFCWMQLSLMRNRSLW